MKREKLLAVLGCILMTLLLCQGNVQAVVQASGKTGVTKTINDWVQIVREMEKAGGALGLNETFQADLTASSESNNLDCHMQKNTEYGAMAILSASAYGKPDKIKAGETTTGNKSGIYINFASEWTAAGTISQAKNYYNMASKYKDDYTTSYKRKIGDAITETEGWHGAGKSSWIIYEEDVGLRRSWNGSIFSYHGVRNGPTESWCEMPYCTRAVVVVEKGL